MIHDIETFWVSVPFISFLIGWLMDYLFGDPQKGFHPVVWFGKWITTGEQRFNRGVHRKRNGAVMAIFLVVAVFCLVNLLLYLASSISVLLEGALTAIGVFYCLAGTTLVREVKAVFDAVSRGIDEGRRQVARIVGRDVSSLSEQEVKAAALETLSENLSDGVIAPMFWYVLLGLPGMLAYKMVNTLDSMVGYRNERYRDFGCVAAKIDDIANYIPARLTAFLMLTVMGALDKISFVKRFGRAHLSPNSGYPEAALAAILDCRFGGTHDYFGVPVEKPYIGVRERTFTGQDVILAVRANRRSECLMVGLVCLSLYFFNGCLF